MLIIGAGASGLMLASQLRNASVCIVDSNTQLGAKVKISGGGKCNISNKYMDITHFDGAHKFVGGVLEKFSTQHLLDYLAIQNLKPTLQNKSVPGQYFCKSSSEVLDFFKNSTRSTKFMMNTKVLDVIFANGQFMVLTTNGEVLASTLVIASGGLSYPALNASPIAYQIAEKFGHIIIGTKPALVGFTLQPEQFWMKELSGVSLPVVIKVADKSFKGDMLFAHRGISGPAVLNASLYWEKGRVTLDFLPNLTLMECLKDAKKQISSQLPLPKNFIKAFLSANSIADKPVCKLSKSELILLEKLKEYEFSPAGNFGYTKAEVTRGGVSTDEVNPETMKSRFCEKLYFIGECLDVAGELGGYNLHWAFASAFVCSKSINSLAR